MECRKCRSTMVPTTAGIEGTAGETHVAMPNFPYNKCERCGSRALVDREFHMFMLEAVLNAIPVADKGGLSRKPSCSKCGAVLEAARASVQTVSASVLVRQRYPLDIEIRAPGFACPSCGTIQFQGGRPEFASELADSLIAAFKPLEPLNEWRES